MDAVFHVGSIKCGSSALQKFLSEQGTLPMADGRKLVYCAITDSGLIHGPALRQRAASCVQGYAISEKARVIRQVMDRDNAVRQSLAQLKDAGCVPVFSREGWVQDYQFKALMDIATDLGLSPEYLLYIRPQAKVINSAWWQHGAWSGKPFLPWFTETLKTSHRWHIAIKACLAHQGNGAMRVRVLGKDIVGDFMDQYGVDKDAISLCQGGHNHSLPSGILRAYQRHPGLRTGPHDSGIDFTMEKYFGDMGDPTPWVISRKRMRLVRKAYRPCNRFLLEYLDADQRARMEADPLWNGVLPPEVRAQSPNRRAPNLEEIDALLGRSLQVIHRLDNDLRQACTEGKGLVCKARETVSRLMGKIKKI